MPVNERSASNFALYQANANPAPMPNKNLTEELTGRELTFGEKAVGLIFNPGGHSEVNSIKRNFADTIDYLNNLRNTAKAENNSEKVRMYSVAITECQSAQMWAVKAATWQY